jgi:hypothetical protein
MNAFISSSFVLAHGFTTTSTSDKIGVLIVIAIFLLGLLICKMLNKISKALLISGLISCALILICILDYYFELPIPKPIKEFANAVVWYPNFINFMMFWSMNDSTGFFISALFVETLIIFALIRLLLYTKHKFCISCKRASLSFRPERSAAEKSVKKEFQ